MFNRHYLIILPGLEALEREALTQKMIEIAEILKPDLRDTMKIQMTPWIATHKVGMSELYTGLKLKKHTITPQKTEKKDLNHYQELFRNLDTNRRILIKGDPGIGKSTFVRRLALDWANDEWTDTELKSIELLFIVSLRFIDATQTIENMIKCQHKCLAENENITEAILKYILEKAGKNCLVILEGFDEIPKNNQGLLKILRNEVIRDCCIMVTSRPNATDEIEDSMGTISSIEGFSKENTEIYIEKMIDDERKRSATFEYMESSALQDMWRYPIHVLFLCLLVQWDEIDLDVEDLQVGDFYTRLLNYLFKRYIADRAETHGVQEEEERREEILLEIGRLAFEGLISNKVAYKKSEIIEAVGCFVFDYGILIGSEEYKGRRFTDDTADIFVYFAHKSIQEYLAAKYFLHQISLTRDAVSILTEDKGWDFIQQNLMFFTFFGYFVKLQKKPSGRLSRMTKHLNFKNKSSPQKRLMEYIQRSLDIEHLILENMAIYGESSWLFLEALPKCSQRQKLQLSG